MDFLDYLILADNTADVYNTSAFECETLSIPEYIYDNGQKYKVSSFALDRVDNKHPKISKIQIPSSIELLSFNENPYIQEVHYNGNIDVILGFENCCSLERVFIHGSVNAIGLDAFRNCYNLIEIIIDNDCEIEIGCRAFANCRKLHTLLVNGAPLKLNFKPSTCCPSALSGCFNFSDFGDSYVIDNGLLISRDYRILYTILGHKSDDTNGTYIIPKSVVDIYHGVSADSIKIIDLTNTSLTKLENRAFEYCKNLRLIKLPETIKEIGFRAFAECKSLIEIENFDKIEVLEPNVFIGSGIKQIAIPSKLTEIPHSTFCECSKLEFVDIHNHVKTIASNAFRGCNSISKVNISIGFKEKLSQLFENAEHIEFNFYDSKSICNGRNYRQTYSYSSAYTYGRLQCPYCCSHNINTYIDGTAFCHSCGGEFVYWK